MASTTKLAGNYAVSGGEGDAEYVAERLQEVQTDRRAEQTAAAQHQSVKERLEQKRDQEERVITVLDETVLFRPVGGDVARQAMELRERAFEEDDASAESALFDLVFDTLGEYAKDDELTADWWAEFPLSVAMNAFEELAMSDLSPAEQQQVEEFRGE